MRPQCCIRHRNRRRSMESRPVTVSTMLISSAVLKGLCMNAMARRLRFEKIQAAHAGHLQVQYQAFHLVAVSGQCKGFRGCESLDAEPQRDE
jgi:hypothetical protein